MRIEPFQQQHWTAQHESNIRYNLIGSGIAPLSMNELLALDGSIPENRMVSLANLPVDYSATNGAVSLREEIAGTYENEMMTFTIDTVGARLRLELRIKPEIRAAAEKEPPPDPSPCDFGLLSGTKDEYIITSGEFKGHRGFFTRDTSGAVVGVDLGGRLFSRVQ